MRIDGAGEQHFLVRRIEHPQYEEQIRALLPIVAGKIGHDSEIQRRRPSASFRRYSAGKLSRWSSKIKTISPARRCHGGGVSNFAHGGSRNTALGGRVCQCARLSWEI
jgi:hypothetical protein